MSNGINEETDKEPSRCDICVSLVQHLKILFMELGKSEKEKDADAKKATLMEMKSYYWLIQAYVEKLLKDCDCYYSKGLKNIQKNLDEIFAQEGIVLDNNKKKCDICRILPCEIFSLLDRACILKNAKDLDSMVVELKYHLTLAIIYAELIERCTECDEFVEYTVCLQSLCDFIESRNQQKLQQDVFFWKMARNNDEIWSSADALNMDENIPWRDVDLKNYTTIYLDFNVYQEYEKDSKVQEFFNTLLQQDNVAIIYSGTHLEEIMRMGTEEYQTKRIESIQNLTGGKIAVVGADKKTVICIQDIHRRFQDVTKYWKMNAAAEERECIQAEAREHLYLHAFDENQEKAIGSSSLWGILENIQENKKKKNEQLPDEEYLNEVLRYVGIGNRSIRDYADALKDGDKGFNEVRTTIVSIAELLNILGLHGDKVKKKTDPGAVYPIYHKDSYQTIRSGYYDNDHLAFATQCTYFVTKDDTLYKKAKEIYTFLGVNTEPILLKDFMELDTIRK